MDRWNGCINCSAGYVLFVRLKLGDESCAFVTVRYATLSWISETAMLQCTVWDRCEDNRARWKNCYLGSHDISSKCTRKDFLSPTFVEQHKSGDLRRCQLSRRNLVIHRPFLFSDRQRGPPTPTESGNIILPLDHSAVWLHFAAAPRKRAQASISPKLQRRPVRRKALT